VNVDFLKEEVRGGGVGDRVSGVGLYAWMEQVQDTQLKSQEIGV
jgi:hypothetical protein